MRRLPNWQATTATRELKTLQEAATNGTLTDELVLANNQFDNSIQTANDFRKYSQDNQLGSQLISFKMRDGKIDDADLDLYKEENFAFTS